MTTTTDQFRDMTYAELVAYSAAHTLQHDTPTVRLVHRALDDNGQVADEQAFAELVALANGATR